jgi:hypothetical protein
MRKEKTKKDEEAGQCRVEVSPLSSVSESALLLPLDYRFLAGSLPNSTPLGVSDPRIYKIDLRPFVTNYYACWLTKSFAKRSPLQRAENKIT